MSTQSTRLYAVKVGSSKEFISERSLFDDQMKGLAYVLRQLTEWERLVLEYRYVKGMSYSEIGTEFALIGSRIRHIVGRALRKRSCPAITAYIQEGFAAHKASILENIHMVMEKKRSTGGRGKFTKTGIC